MKEAFSHDIVTRRFRIERTSSGKPQRAFIEVPRIRGGYRWRMIWSDRREYDVQESELIRDILGQEPLAPAARAHRRGNIADAVERQAALLTPGGCRRFLSLPWLQHSALADAGTAMTYPLPGSLRTIL